MKKLLSLLFGVIFFCCLGTNAFPVTHDVIMSNLSFQPGPLTINAGDTVRWINHDSVLHTVTSGTNCQDNIVWTSSGFLSNGQTFSVTFNEAGTYPYFCTLHCFSGMTGTIFVNPVSSNIPLPATTDLFSSAAVEIPILNNNPAEAKPIGVGSVASGGNNLDLRVGTNSFSGAVDMYLLLFIPVLDPVNIYQVTASGEINNLSGGLFPWKTNVVSSVDADVFGTIPKSLLPPGIYTFGLVVVPAGDISFLEYYFWVTSVVF